MNSRTQSKICALGKTNADSGTGSITKLAETVCFPGAYGMTDEDEFFAEFTESYFDRPSDIQWRWDDEDEGLTRQKLSADFPEIFSFLERIYVGWQVGSYLVLDADSSDRDILVELYNSTGGPCWVNSENWLTDTPIRYWYGVHADGNGRVTQLGLEANGLTGEIPSELGNLANLGVLSPWRQPAKWSDTA